MIVDGKKIAEEIEKELTERVQREGSRTLAIVQVGDNPVSSRYTKRKQAIGERIGVSVVLKKFPEDVPQFELMSAIEEIANDVDGIIVQLPLPDHLDEDLVLNTAPDKKDVDALSVAPYFIAPVAGVVREILERHNISIKDKCVTIIGYGKLVGKPVAKWCTEHGAKVSVADIDTKDLTSLTKGADIIVTGAGSPHLLKSDMITDGVVLIDAGTSESSGKLVGDIDPACAEKAALFTPVPGGVGPITVVMLFKNLLS